MGFFQDDEEDDLPQDGAPEVSPEAEAAADASAAPDSAKIRDYLSKKYGAPEFDAAANDQDLKDAQTGASRGKMIANIGQALAGFAGAGAIGNGGKAPVDKSLYDSMRSDQGAKVAQAQADRDAKIKDFLIKRGFGRDEMKDKQTAEAQKLQREDRISRDEMHARERDEDRADRAQGRKDMFAMDANRRRETASTRAAERDEDRRWKEEQVANANEQKKSTTLNEIEDRRSNINSGLDTLDKMIEDHGTWEAFGSHNQDMDRLVDQVATDMAKLQDPNSVARPSEVDAVKRNLISSGFKNSNETARNIIKNFRSEVERRADSAYKVRGLADRNPHKASNVAGRGGSGSWGEAQAAPAGKPKTVIQGGHTYTLNEETGEYE